jgi:1-acyl-sn-glycerol-3-phosphate acyltransferase
MSGKRADAKRWLEVADGRRKQRRAGARHVRHHRATMSRGVTEHCVEVSTVQRRQVRRQRRDTLRHDHRGAVPQRGVESRVRNIGNHPCADGIQRMRRARIISDDDRFGNRNSRESGAHGVDCHRERDLGTQRGGDRQPGGFILAANHVSYVDPLTLGLYVLESGRTAKFLAKSSLFEKPLLKHVFIGANQIPVYRGTADASKALSAAVEAVNEGHCLLIYPEGSATRDPDHWPMKARTGVARLALMTGAPVIPVAQWGPQKLWRYKAKLPRPFPPRKRIQVLTGDPVDLSAYADRPMTAEVLREVTDLIMARITDLLIELRGGHPPAETYDPKIAA